MAKQTIELGVTANDNTGDRLRSGGQKVNDNFTEVYNAIAYADNATTIALSNATLNATYPSVVVGYKVYALAIIAGSLIYLKTTTGWVSVPATIVL
jgi:hypothetical protein